MKLTNNFTLEELTRTSSTYPNMPSTLEKIALKQLAVKVLQPLRDAYGKSIRVNSGYRSPLVNKSVGGVPTSQHIKGEAADITGGSKEENKVLFDLIKNTLDFDQLINERDYTWIHVSYKTKGNRKQILKL